MSTYTRYPDQVDTSTELPKATDLVTPVNGEAVNRLREAILAVENELGAQPSGTFSTVRARLDAMDTALSSLGADVGSIDPTIEILHDDVSINANANAVNFSGNVDVTANGEGVNVEIIGGQATQIHESLNPTNGQTSFTLSNEPFQINGVHMFVNGLKMRYGFDYTVSGNTVTYSDDISLVSTDEVEFWYLVDSAGLVGSSSLVVQDEGVTADAAVTTLNFTGDAIVTNPSPGVISVAIAGGGVTVENLAALAVLDDSTLDDGAVAAVASLDDEFFIDRADIGTPDGITRIATDSAVGNWVRRGNSSLLWRSQATWFIDGTSGNDEATGLTSGTAIKTQAEWARRTGSDPIVVQTITFTTSTSEDMIWALENTYDQSLITVKGPDLTSLTPIYTGTITAVPQNWDESVREDGQITVDALPVSFTDSGLVDKLCVVTSGAAAGYSFWIAKDLGSKTARTTIATDMVEGFGYAYPEVGDVFEVYDLVALEGQQFVALKGHSSAMYFQDLTVGISADGPHQGRSTLGECIFTRCKVYGWDANGASYPQFYGSSTTNLKLYNVSAALCFASVNHGTLNVHQGKLVPEWMLVQDGGIVLDDHRAFLSPVGYLAVYGVATAITMGPGSQAECSTVDVWGGDISGTGIIASADARFITSTTYAPEFDAPTFATIGGFDVTDANPIETANGAAIVWTDQVDYAATADNYLIEAKEALSVTQQTRTTDSATQALTIAAQSPFTTATGTNRVPGNIVLEIGTPTNGGTTYGKISAKLAGSERLAINYGGTLTSIDSTSAFALTSTGNIGLRPTSYAGNLFEFSHSLSEALMYSPITSRFQSSAAVAFQAGTSVAFISTNARFYNGSSQELLQFNDLGSAAAEISGTNSLTLTAGIGGGARITLPTMTGDVNNAPIIGIKGSNASATASTAGRKRGGAVSIESGRGQTPGTDFAGPIYIGLGEQVALYTSGIKIGSGPAVGTPGTPDYVPYTDYAGQINAIGGGGRIWYSANNHMTLGVEVGACGIDMNTSTTVISANSININSGTGAITATAGTYISQIAPTIYHTLSNAAGLQIGDAVGARQRIRTPAAITTTATTADQVLDTILITVASAFESGIRRIEGEVIAWRTTGETMVVEIDQVWKNVGGTGTLVSAKANVTSGDALGTVAFVSSGTGVSVCCTPAAATSTRWVFNGRESRYGG